MNKKEILSLIATLEQNPGQLTKHHLKKLYAILIACGHYPICPWCNEPIYNINDFSWDHITPRALGGTDDLENLQPMHKHCNNESKQAIAYDTEYKYDIKAGLEQTILNVNITLSRPKKYANIQHATEKYKNHKRHKQNNNPKQH
ncbi:MAG: HNH endonuclease [Alphaproteobacteria bacterium]|jgi:hypothetical protein|nr:HNH endonuclease [Alphaproteobacteria bacterium]